MARDNISIADTTAELEAGRRSLDERNERMRATLSLAGVAGAWEWQIGEGRTVVREHSVDLVGEDLHDDFEEG